MLRDRQWDDHTVLIVSFAVDTRRENVERKIDGVPRAIQTFGSKVAFANWVAIIIWFGGPSGTPPPPSGRRGPRFLEIKATNNSASCWNREYFWWKARQLKTALRSSIFLISREDTSHVVSNVDECCVPSCVMCCCVFGDEWTSKWRSRDWLQFLDDC